MYTRSETIYYAEDGKEFKSISKCRDYENNLLKNSTMECWDYHGIKIDDLSESADLTNAYEVRLTNTKGLYKQVTFIVTANTLSEVYEKLWHTIKQEHIKYEVSNLGCVVNLNEIESHVKNWLELN